MLPNATAGPVDRHRLPPQHHVQRGRRRGPGRVRTAKTWSTASTLPRRCGWALTLGCAQCHDHKFDPFSQKDYYRFLAFFANSDRAVREYGDTSTKFVEPVLDLPTPAQAARRKELQAEIAGLETLLETGTPELAAEQARWEAGIRDSSADWTVLDSASVRSAGGATLTRQPGGAILASGTNPSQDEYVVEARLPAAGITGIRLEALPHPSLPRGGPGRDPYGNFFIEEFHAELVRGGQAEPLAIRKTVADDGRLRDKKFSQLWSVDATRDESASRARSSSRYRRPAALETRCASASCRNRISAGRAWDASGSR